MELAAEILAVDIGTDVDLLELMAGEVERFEHDGRAVLRCGFVGRRERTALLEVASVSDSNRRATPTLGAIFRSEPQTSDSVRLHGELSVALVIPTGVGASTGGFIGDAGPVARAMTSVSDIVVVHPNVVTAADFYACESNICYVDGLTLDRFFLGAHAVAPPRSNRIGVILDTLDAQTHVDMINACNAMRTVQGIDIVGVVACEAKIHASVSRSEVGHFLGRVSNPEVLFRAAESLTSSGAQAIAVVTDIGGVGENDVTSHYAGSGPNPVGALEALISRAITWRTGLPCAHAPAFNHGLGRATYVTDPRVAGEVASGTGLPSVLHGLSRAARAHPNGLAVTDLSAIVVPLGCAGGPPAWAAARFGIPLVAVRSNTTTVGVAATSLTVPRLFVVDNYGEALGFLASLRAGVTWESVRGVIGSVEELE